MKTINSYSYIAIGLFTRFIRGLEENAEKKKFINGIDSLKTYLLEANFSVSLVAIESLITFRNKFENESESTPLISLEDANEIREEVAHLEKTIFAEASTKQIYSLTNRRYNSEYLLNSPEKLFNEKIFEKIPEFYQLDIKYANFCILFGLGTAAAFHILRASEGILRDYYKQLVKKNRITTLLWNPMIEHLRNKKTSKPPKTLLDNLDNIRYNYRNPTNHPELFYNIDEAQDLYGLCIDVINKMIKEINK